MTITTAVCTLWDMENIGLNIRIAREASGLNQSELARTLGVTPQAVQKWEAGETVPRGGRLQGVADALGITVSALMDSKISPAKVESGASPPAPSGRTIVIPRLDVSGSMGNGLSQPDGHTDVIERMTVNADWIRQSVSASAPGSLAVITGRGDSMEGTFSDGDLLLVDRGITDLRMDAVYVMAIDGELYIKRIQRQPGGSVIMLSDNPRYAPIEIRPADLASFHVLARVLLVWSACKL